MSMLSFDLLTQTLDPVNPYSYISFRKFTVFGS